MKGAKEMKGCKRRWRRPVHKLMPHAREVRAAHLGFVASAGRYELKSLAGGQDVKRCPATWRREYDRRGGGPLALEFAKFATYGMASECVVRNVVTL